MTEKVETGLGSIGCWARCGELPGGRSGGVQAKLGLRKA